MTEDLQARLQGVVADIFDISESAVTPQLSGLNCEAWDSGRHIALIIAVEQNFGVKFSILEIEAATSFGALLATLRRKTA
jgi:acyl carrier protein